MKIKVKSHHEIGTIVQFFKIIYEMRDLGIVEEYDSFTDRYYNEGSDSDCEYVMIKYPGWIERYYDRYDLNS